MAGSRLTLKKLAKKYGITDIKGLTYTQLIQEIVNDNVERATKKMGTVSNRRMRKAFAESVKDGVIELPEFAVPNATLRKSAEDGKMITDTLRDTLTRGLRKAITENPNDAETAINQMQQHITNTMNTYKSSHAKLIAVTEVRSALDLSKNTYIEQLLARNPNKFVVTKKWIHHNYLVKVPRPTHKAIDGEKVPFGQPFSIGLMYPHDPNAPASEVIGCQCGYRVEIEERAVNEAWKSLYHNLRIYKAYRVGTRRERADGYTYEKQSDGSWIRVKENTNALRGEQGTDNQGQSVGGQTDSRGVSGQSTVSGMDTGLQRPKNKDSNREMDNVRNRGLERWVAIDDFRTRFGESPTRVFDNGVVETNNKELFSKQFMKIRDENPLGLKVSPKKAHDLRGAQMFMSPDGSYTCAVTKNGVLTAVCGTAHKGDYEFTDHTLKDLLKQALKSGAKKCDCYGEALKSIYESMGYKVVGKARWNPEFWNNDGSASPNNETDPKKVFPTENGEPEYYYLAYTDEEPEVQDVSDWKWEDIEKLQDKYARKYSAVEKARGSINPATGQPYKIGETKVRPDGTEWVKTGTFSWAKAGTKDAEQAKKQDTNSDGKVDGDDKKDGWKEIEGQSAKDAFDIARTYGEKGIYQLTKGGLLNFLHAQGVDNPKSLSWQEKVDKYKEIVGKMGKDEEVKIKTEGKEEFTEEDFHIVHNKDFEVNLIGDDTVLLRNGVAVRINFDENGNLTDKTYDKLMANIKPEAGGHWGSAKTNNYTALAVALVNAPDWKPIDEMKNGQLVEYRQDLNSNQYKSALVRGLALRKYAQESLKHPDMSRDKIPYFYRGMTVDPDQFEQILSGEVDTIELTGCTAMTSFEDVADQYAGSAWTKGFGADRRSIKLIIERDDYLDNSIGMFHNNTKGYAHGNRNIAFELLTGSPSFYIKSVSEGEAWNAEKASKEFTITRRHPDDKIGDRSSIKYNSSDDYWSAGSITRPTYYQIMFETAENEARKTAEPINKQIEDWMRNYFKEHAPEYFSKVKNKDWFHKNNVDLRNKWYEDLENAWKTSDLYKKIPSVSGYVYDDIYNDAERSVGHAVMSSRGDVLEDTRKKIDAVFDKHKDGLVSSMLLDPVQELRGGSISREYNKYLQNQPVKRDNMTFKMYLDKRKPLAKSYKTQVDKTQEEYDHLVDLMTWRRDVVMNYDRLNKIEDQEINKLMKEYKTTPEKFGDAFKQHDGVWRIVNPWSIADDELRNKVKILMYSRPQMSSDGIAIPSPHAKDEDNPYVKDLIKDPRWADREKMSADRFNKLADMRKKYENALKENELVDKYKVLETPRATFDQRIKDIDKKIDDLAVDRNTLVMNEWLEQNKDKYTKDQLQFYTERMQRQDYSGIPDTYSIIASMQKSPEYQKLRDQENRLRDEQTELGKVLDLYKGYNDKIAESHKNMKPLEVHVVAGRGKKSLTAGSDDGLEETDNDNN